MIRSAPRVEDAFFDIVDNISTATDVEIQRSSEPFGVDILENYVTIHLGETDEDLSPTMAQRSTSCTLKCMWTGKARKVVTDTQSDDTETTRR
jgi:hypothetical protein